MAVQAPFYNWVCALCLIPVHRPLTVNITKSDSFQTFRIVSNFVAISVTTSTLFSASFLKRISYRLSHVEINKDLTIDKDSKLNICRRQACKSAEKVR